MEQSKIFATYVKKMRTAQKNYFATKSHDALKESRHYEAIVDDMTDMLLDPNPTIF